MRWSYDDFKPYLGHERVVEKFLLLPVWIKGEARWLEKGKILQRWGFEGGRLKGFYRNYKWLN